MTFKSSNFKDIIEKHLTCVNSIEGQLKVQSSLPKALIEARWITGRDAKTGEPLPDSNSQDHLGWWSGTVIYLTILDHIGAIYKIKEQLRRFDDKPQDILKALDYFAPEIDLKKATAIYALRCAFHHDFSLINIGKSKDMHFNFGLHQFATGEVVEFRKNFVDWDGELCSLNESNQTIINVKRLGDLVEDIYKRILSLNAKNKLEICLVNGEIELKRRYFLAHP